MKKIAISSLILIIAIICLSSCKHLSSNYSTAPAEVSSVNTGEQETTPNSIDKAETNPTISEETLAYEKAEDESMRVVSEVNGRIIQTKIDCKNGKSILVDAVVDTTNISSVNCYSYSICPLTDHIRDSILNAYLGDRFSEVEYDERNDMWILKNSDQVGNYYMYTTSYGWDGLPEEMFNLEYRNVNLYPFEDNLLSSVEDVSMNLSLEDALSLCNHMIEALPNSGRYTVDYVLPFGNNGRSQYYWIVYKQQLGGMPITAYGDLKFLVDGKGIEHISGAIFDIGMELGISSLLSVDEAMEILSYNAPLISFDETIDQITISKISMEYVVLKDEEGAPVITPVWRFQIGSNDEERNLKRERIIAINAMSGDFIQERRRHTF